MQKHTNSNRMARVNEELKREIKAELLADIKLTVDISEAIQEIDELRRAIEKLGK